MILTLQKLMEGRKRRRQGMEGLGGGEERKGGREGES